MKTNLDIALGIFTAILCVLYAALGVHAYAEELWNVAINGLKSMDCIKFYLWASHTAVLGVLAKYFCECD